MPAIGLEGDLNPHRMTDQDCPIDLDVVENSRDIIREIFDGHPFRIARRSCSTMTSVMRMDAEPIGEVFAQVSPDVTVAADAVAK